MAFRDQKSKLYEHHLNLKYTYQVKETMFLVQLFLFVLKIFPKAMLDTFMEAMLKTDFSDSLSSLAYYALDDPDILEDMKQYQTFITRGETQEDREVRMYIVIALKVGSFIQPKAMVASFDNRLGVPYVVQQKLKRLMNFECLGEDGRMIKLIFGHLKDQQQILNLVNHFKSEKGIKPGTQFQFWMSPLTNDFCGLLTGLSDNHKVDRCIPFYRYCFRFSMEKLLSFCSDPCMVFLTLEYLHRTKLERIHLKPCMANHN